MLYRSTFAFIVGQTNVWFQGEGNNTFIQKDELSKLASPMAADLSSDDSASTDEDVADQCKRIQQIIKVSEDKAKLFELDSRVGLNGSKSHWSFPCMQDEESKRFYIWLGDVSIEKLTKSIFMNLVNFAEKAGSQKMILIQDRDHRQKDQFQKLFKVLDAHRVSKRGMEEMIQADQLNECIESYALYRIDLVPKDLKMFEGLGSNSLSLSQWPTTAHWDMSEYFSPIRLGYVLPIALSSFLQTPNP
ncbi:UNKNOWN [Stylonychia lemnae]|uniref:Uncharacterized protein n=1 Tax=Stylonychia lemnae TaxID=5949 RepID=A0A078AS55_STYLE|nr:UNKNOWN [Stylonychia lemnae]|eukprot:CDW84047.1 UNKNOWN [Stylonychia lemnae]